ncbi:MAG: Gfo/Idh/MocA family oxidoreductase [Cyclobacteriaceae bacterium]|nr:Gfo/Idh/MocA family oxidoreductase [Cyclobacteriaceae bacterium]
MYKFLLFILVVSSAVAQESKKPFRIGVAGLTHGHVHWVLNRAHDGDFEIVGIAEPNRVLAEQLLNQYKLPISLLYPSLNEMLDKTRPEAVTGFGNTFDHLSVVQACAPRKIHVMVEKPLAVSLDHAKQIQQLAKVNSILVLTNYETTWYGSNTKLEELFRTSKPMGPVRKVVVHDGHEGPKEINVGPEFLEWLIDPVKNGGGALMDFGCYGANQITWLLNGERPLSVFAVTQQIKPHIYPKVDDEATIILTYAKAQGIIQASWNWPLGRKDMEVYGEKGYVIADRQGSKIKSVHDKPETFVAGGELPKPLHDPFTYLAAAVRGEIKILPYDLSALENNMLVMEILEAAKQSAKTGKTIPLAAKP